MFSKALSHFFRTKTATPIPPKEWLNAHFVLSGLDAQFSENARQRTKKTAKVFFNQRYFTNNETQSPFSLIRSLTKITAINVAGDSSGCFQNGTPFPTDPDFFARIPLMHPELLSPLERLTAAKKIVFSRSSVFASGGYPLMTPRQIKKKPYDVGIFSLAGASFENSYLHYSIFMLDLVNQNVSYEQFSHLYKNLPTDFKEAQSSLGQYDTSPSIMRIRTGLPLLARSSPDRFYSSFTKKNAVIFLSEAYYRHQLEDISMLLTSVNEAAKESGKPAFLKATAVGMGFFAKVNGEYDIQHVLYPYYLRAFQKLLSENSYPWIAKIEFPTFSEQQQEQFNSIMEKPCDPIEVCTSSRDVLEFTEEEGEDYFICAINPSDAFAFTGNEWGFSSVESAIGLNSSLRMDQIPLENPVLLEHDHHVAIKINSSDFSAEIVPPTPNSSLLL